MAVEVEAAERQLNTETEAGEITDTQSDGPSQSWPAINYALPPYRSYHFFNQFRTPSNPNKFLKGVKWSPDGSCFLTCSDDNTLSIFSLPYDESGYLIADCSAAEESGPDTCVFATSTRDHPIHLWDAFSGQLRCTYRAYNAVDEITAAFSIAFNPSGTKIFAGYNKSLRVFDIHRPGREYGHHSTLDGKKEGQSGIISSIAFSPSHNGLLATGSYSQSTALYREDNMELLYVLHGQEGGVTQVQFSKDGNYLYTGGRKDPYILCWDLRNTVEIVYKLYRSSETTNQRIYFDVEPHGHHLGTGGQDGSVHIYDLQTGNWVSSFHAASDTINGFSYHPFLPMAATSSGNRRFLDFDDSSEDLVLTENENCVSVWSFYSSTESTASSNADLDIEDDHPGGV
ncbi:unnamed protein product [Cuscuta epithymum]|uniref:Telomerase Cajal body protein 1 n=1 Tax=Cuscuta epithymum TaxID=186058 RepID=A0AAV0FE39_9ASTE|nr:unnamed protein product [Cuscuta epithymum]